MLCLPNWIVALLVAAAAFGKTWTARSARPARLRFFHVDPALKLISSLDEEGAGLALHTKGAPEVVLERSTRRLDGAGDEQPLSRTDRERIADVIDTYARRGLRVIGVARRRPGEVPTKLRRSQVERDLCFLGLVALFDPPRPEVAAAVARCHTAGIRVIVVTGDHALTAAEMARRVGIDAQCVVSGDELEDMSEARLDELLAGHREMIFARNSPEGKLRVADALRAQGEVVA